MAKLDCACRYLLNLRVVEEIARTLEQRDFGVLMHELLSLLQPVNNSLNDFKNNFDSLFKLIPLV